MSKFIMMPAWVWLDTQLSIARHYGAVKYNNEIYIILGDNNDLVHQDYALEYTLSNRKQFRRKYRKNPNLPSPLTLRSRKCTAQVFANNGIDVDTLPSVYEENGATKVTIPINKDFMK